MSGLRLFSLGHGWGTGTCYIKDSPLKNTSANVRVCVCVCVTLAWPGAKVGCPERQCVSSHAFSSRLAGFITATDHWPDKSSYFILPSSSSASSLSPPFPPLFVVLHASPCAPPHSLSLIALFPLSSVFFSLSLLPTHPYCSAPPPPFYCSVSAVWWICRRGLIIVLQHKCSFFFVFESSDRHKLLLLNLPSLCLYLFSHSFFHLSTHTMGT